MTQLKIAARRNEDTRTTRAPDEVPAVALAVIDEEVRRSHGEWRRTLDAVKETLATLERTCESAIETHDAGIGGLVESLAESARKEAVAAAQQTRAQAEIEIEELRGALERNEIALQAAREALKSAADQLDAERTARSRAESERDAFQRSNEHITSQLQTMRNDREAQKAELSLVRQQLEAERAERSSLNVTLHAIRNALCLPQSEHPAITPPPAESPLPEAAAHHVSTASPTPDVLEPDPVTDPVVVIAPFPEVVEHAKRLLEQAEAMYRADLDAGCSPLDVVDRLTAILRYSRDLIVGRWGSDECDAAAVFRQEVDTVLEANAETSFGRHLSIAAFAARSSKPPAAN